MHCPHCGRDCKIVEKTEAEKDGRVRYYNNVRIEMSKEDMAEYNFPNNWDKSVEDESIKWECPDGCGYGHEYHPIYGKLHAPGDSFCYYFEWIK
jgi:hypothetical protein